MHVYVLTCMMYMYIHSQQTNKQTSLYILHVNIYIYYKHSFIKNKTNALLTHFRNLLKHEHITPELILVS